MKKNKTKLKVAIVLPTIISKNGTAKQSLELSINLVKKGHDVKFFTFAYSKKNSFPEFRKFKILYLFDVDSSLIYKFIKNVVVLENIFLYVALILIHKFRNLFHSKIIDIYNTHDWFSMWVVGGLNQKSAINIANINDVPARESSPVDKVKLFFDRKYSKKFSHFIVLDNQNRKKLIKWLNVSNKKISVIRSGIDIKKYRNFNRKIDLKRKLNIDKNGYLLVCGNLLAKNRRYEDAIEAVSRLKNLPKQIHLLILSKLDFDPSYAAFLRKQVADKKLGSQIHFIDKFFSDEERMLYIKNSDLLVFPNAPQTWGLTVIEAMALGVPTIVSTGSGVSEVLTDNINSLIYKQRDTEQLTEKIRLCLNSQSLSKKIVKTARNFVFSSFSWDKFAKQTEKILKKYYYLK